MVNKQEIEFIKITNINQAVGKNKLYCLKLPNENSFSLIVTDLNGVRVPLKDLQGSGGITSILNTDGNLVVAGNVINISPSLLATINSALQAGDNISTLINDAGYLTSFTETDPIFQASEASSFVAGDKANLDNQSGVNSGDETTSSIQTKRPLKTIEGSSLEGTGNINLNIPTTTSDLTNDSNFVVDALYVHTDNNYTTIEKSKLAGIEAGAEVNNISDVNATDLTDGGETTLHIHDSRYYTETESDLQLQKKQNLPTGFITGLQLSINADPTKVDIAPGAYAISDFTDLENITVQIIQIISPITGITPDYLNTGNISYIALDINQDVIQSSSPFTNEQRRTLAIIGAAIHSNLVNVNVVNEIKSPIVAPTNQLHDLMRAIGSFNLEGNIYSANGSNLQLDKSAGTVFGLGINANNYLNPHQLNLTTQTGLTFRYRLQTGFEYSNTTAIDPINYDNGGVLTPLLNNNKWQVQRINLFQSGLTRVQPGQHQYDSLEEAEANIKVETFTTETNIAENAIFRSYLIVKKNAINLSDITQAKFIPVDKFGNVITGNTALTFANIVSALGYTPENEANKQDSLSIDGTGAKYPTVDATNAGLATKQDNLTETNFGAFANTLSIKLTPSADDEIVTLDSITGEAVTIKYSYFNSGAPTLTEVELDFGTKPVNNRTFTIIDVTVVNTNKIIITPSPNNATGQLGNDWEVDGATFSAKANTGDITLYVNAPFSMNGKRKIYYQILN